MDPVHQNGCVPVSKVRRMDSSTPKLEYRNSKPVDWPCSPLKSSPEGSSNTIETLGSSFQSSVSSGMNISEAGLSPELRKLLIRPRNKGEESELRDLLITTINLTRAAIGKGFDEYLANDLEMVEIKLANNTFYRFASKESMITDLLEKLKITDEKHAIVILGRNALEPWNYQCPNILNPLSYGTVKTDVWRKSVLYWNVCLDDLVYYKVRPAELVYLDLWCEEFLLKPVDETDILQEMDDVFKLKVTTLIGGNVLRLGKRKFQIHHGALMGSLSKHSTPMKEDDNLRKRLNQTFFTGGPVCSLSKMGPKCSQVSARPKPKAKRRLTVGPGQQTISSIFSPKIRAIRVDNTTRDDPNELDGSVNLVEKSF